MLPEVVADVRTWVKKVNNLTERHVLSVVVAGLDGPGVISRHCERSEAIHRAAKEAWIASSLRSSQ